MLWDGEQTAAFLAGAPVPALPDSDDDEDLLERIEAAAVLGVAPDTWNHYKQDPRIARHLVSVKGVGTARAGSCAHFGRRAQVAGAHRQGQRRHGAPRRVGCPGR